MLVDSSKEAIELLGPHPKLGLKIVTKSFESLRTAYCFVARAPFEAHRVVQMAKLSHLPTNGQVHEAKAHVLPSLGQCWVKQHSQNWSLPGQSEVSTSPTNPDGFSAN